MLAVFDGVVSALQRNEPVYHTHAEKPSGRCDGFLLDEREYPLPFVSVFKRKFADRQQFVARDRDHPAFRVFGGGPFVTLDDDDRIVRAGGRDLE